MKNFVFEDLRVHYGTGRSYTISGEGRNRVLGYRVGKKCNAGDIEVSEWCTLVKDAIEKAGEKDLYSQLHAFMSERNYIKAAKSALEEEALELHAARIFDNQEWVYFIDFNEQYRPHVLESVKVVTVLPECCKVPGRITRAGLERHGSGEEMNYCPHCKKWTGIRVVPDV